MSDTPFDRPTEWAQDIVAEMHTAIGSPLTDAQREAAVAWLLPHCQRWAAQATATPDAAPLSGEAVSEAMGRAYDFIRMARALDPDCPEDEAALGIQISQAILAPPPEAPGEPTSEYDRLRVRYDAIREREEREAFAAFLKRCEDGDPEARSQFLDIAAASPSKWLRDLAQRGGEGE